MSSSSNNDAHYDAVLMSIAQGCQGGVPEFFDKIFGFLARKTDFYTEDQDVKCRDMIDSAYNKYSLEVLIGNRGCIWPYISKKPKR